MFNVGGGEVLVILLVALVVLGPDKLPGAVRSVGNMVGELRKLSNGFQSEMRNAMYVDDRPAPASPPTPESGATAGTADPGSQPPTEAQQTPPPSIEAPTGDARRANDALFGPGSSADPSTPGDERRPTE
jgi:sec-independent protein translocase protein TatB